MKTLTFSKEIKATPKQLWESLWAAGNYKKWTAVFTEGSYYKTERFAEGNVIHLLTPKGNGMYSVLDKVVEPEYLAFRHIGMLKDFEEMPLDEETRQWTNAMETYELTVIDEQTTKLTVKVDTFETYEAHMNKMFPVALEKLRLLIEK